MRSRRSTGSSSSAAASLTGRGAGRPREPGRSGCGTTASTSCAAATAWRAGTAKSAVPQKTMRIRMPPGAVRLRSADELALERRGLLLVGAVPLLQRALDHLGGEEDAVEVIDLMLDGAGEQPVALDADLLAVAVQPPGHDTVAALHLADQSGDGEAALIPRLLALAAHHLGVGELVDLVVDLEDDDAQRHAHLGGGEAGAVGVDHGLDHVVHELADGVVDAGRARGPGDEDGILVSGENDGEQCHGSPHGPGSTSMLQPLPLGRCGNALSIASPRIVTCQRYSPRRRWRKAGVGPRPSRPDPAPSLSDTSATARRASSSARASSRWLIVHTTMRVYGGNRNAFRTRISSRAKAR